MMEKVKEPGHTMSGNAGGHNTCNRTACKAYQSTPSPHPHPAGHLAAAHHDLNLCLQLRPAVLLW